MYWSLGAKRSLIFPYSCSTPHTRLEKPVWLGLTFPRVTHTTPLNQTFVRVWFEANRLTEKHLEALEGRGGTCSWWGRNIHVIQRENWLKAFPLLEGCGGKWPCFLGERTAKVVPSTCLSVWSCPEAVRLQRHPAHRWRKLDIRLRFQP